MLISDNKIFFFIVDTANINCCRTINFINKYFIDCLFIFIYFFVKKTITNFYLKINVTFIICFLYIYLIFNSFISLDFEIGLMRNAWFYKINFSFFSYKITFFFISQKNLNVFNIWSIFLLIFLSDVYFEKFTGANIFGWGGNYGPRIVGFLKMNQ